MDASTTEQNILDHMCIKQTRASVTCVSYSSVSKKRAPSDSLKVFRGNGSERVQVSRGGCPSLGALHFHKRNCTKRLWSNSREFTTNLFCCSCCIPVRASKLARVLLLLLVLVVLSRLVLVLSASESCCLWSEVCVQSEWRVASSRCLINPSALRGSRAPLNETARGGECDCVRVCVCVCVCVYRETRESAHRLTRDRNKRLSLARYIITPVYLHWSIRH